MIYDCITFFNELEMLDLRLNILNEYVDKFVIVEGNRTHTGAYKEFILEKNFELFSTLNMLQQEDKEGVIDTKLVKISDNCYFPLSLLIYDSNNF